jgi:putative (di)nucleoside polyphosphate hydrolase
MLINRAGKIFVARRIDGDRGDWQMPQGAIYRGETPRDAMLRELREEIGTDRVEILAESEDWRSHEAAGWRQKWFLALFKGGDGDIKLSIDNPAFDTWRWVSPVELSVLAESFKRQLYLDLQREFSGAISAAMMLIGASARKEPSTKSNNPHPRRGFRGIDGPEDRAALISAIGWCSGWSSLAALIPLGRPSPPSHVRSVG